MFLQLICEISGVYEMPSAQLRFFNMPHQFSFSTRFPSFLQKFVELIIMHFRKKNSKPEQIVDVLQGRNLSPRKTTSE